MENKSNELHGTEKVSKIVPENEAKSSSVKATVDLLKFMALSERDMPLWTITVLWKFFERTVMEILLNF